MLLGRGYALRNAGLVIAGVGVGLAFSLSGDARILWLVGLLFTGGPLRSLKSKAGRNGRPRHWTRWASGSVTGS
jgi:hypothetical protein